MSTGEENMKAFSAISQVEWERMLKDGWDFGAVGSDLVLKSPAGELWWNYADIDEMNGATGSAVECAAGCDGECDCVAVGPLYEDDERSFVSLGSVADLVLSREAAPRPEAAKGT